MRIMQISRIGTIVAVVLAAALLGDAAAVRAGVDVAFGASVQIGDDADVYFAVSSRYYDRDQAEMRHWERQYGGPDDLAVAMFICRHAASTPERVFGLRAEGLTWWEIGLRLGVPAEAWFVPVRRDPGPPYGKAYGHWKKHGRQAPERIALGDVDARNLVAVRLLHEYYGVSVEVAMDWRSSGRDLSRLTADEYRNRHGKPGGVAKAGSGSGAGVSAVGGEGPSQGEGKAKGKGRGKK